MLPTERAWNALLLPLVKLGEYTGATIGTPCFKESGNFTIVTQKQDNHLLSKELIALQAAALGGEIPGARTET